MQRRRDDDHTKEQGRSETRFDSFSEFMDYIEKEPSKALGGLTSRTLGVNSIHGTKNFFGGAKSMDEAMTLAREGWQGGLEMIQSLTARLENVTGSMVRKQEIAWDVTGDFADAGLFVTGVPECMGAFIETDPVQGAGRIVKILMNLSVSSGVKTDAIMRRGAAVAALVDALENAGRSCELEIASGTAGQYGGAGWKVMTIVPVKHAGEPLELDRLAFLLAHPSSFRRLFFSAWEHEPNAIRRHIGIKQEGGYGCCLDHKDETANIVVPTMDLHNYPDDESLLAWVKSELVRQGCEIEGMI